VEPEAQRPGEPIRVHMPLPVATAQCEPGDITASPDAYLAAPDHPQRTACFEAAYQPGMAFTTTAAFTIRAPYVEPKPEDVTMPQPAPDPADVAEVPPQVRFTPLLRALADELAGDETNPLVIARRFYDYCTVNCAYRFVRAYAAILQIPEYFAAGRRGDCGVHALLFITLCRIKGIPAQWQAGLYARPGDVGCHDWARFFIAPYGWLWADCSFGGAAYREGSPDRWNYYFGNLEPWRCVYNRDFQQAFDPPKRFERADPYDSQTGEAEYEDRGLTGRETDVDWTMTQYELADGI